MSVVLDTNVCSYLLTGRLADPIDRDGTAVSAMTELELLAFPGITDSEEAAAQQLLTSVEVIGLTDPVRAIAIRVRREHRLRVPDAIVAATAMSRGATLLTNDSVFVRVPTLTVRRPTLHAADANGSH